MIDINKAWESFNKEYKPFILNSDISKTLTMQPETLKKQEIDDFKPYKSKKDKWLKNFFKND